MNRITPITAVSALASAVLVALGGVASAEQGAPPSAQLPEFNQLDADGSRYIEPTEAQQVLDRMHFSAADADRDMRLSQDEYGQLKSQVQAMAAQAQPGGDAQQGEQERMQAQSGAQQQQQSGTEIVVEEQPSRVEVEQKPPQVTVQQQPPEVTIVQPEPDVQIQQPQPKVTVRQAQPQVDVQQQGEPEVIVQSPGEPQVQYREAQQAQQQAQPQQQAQQPSQAASSQSIEGKTLNELSGMSVVTSDGQDVGEVEKIVREMSTNELHAVISGGGFLGIGEDRAAVPLQNLQLRQDQLVWQQAQGEQTLEQKRYNEQQYSDIQQQDLTVAELTGGREPASGGGQQQASFQQLDRDADGAISQSEADQFPPLQQQWNQADADGDGEVNQTEFSAFEEQITEVPSQGGGAATGGSPSGPPSGSPGGNGSMQDN